METKNYSILYIVYVHNSIQHNGLISPESYQFNNISSLSTVTDTDRYICQLQLGKHTVAAVQYTFTHKQYIEQHK